MSTQTAQNFALPNNPKLGVSQAASYLKITPSTLRRLETEGKISSERLANGYRQYNFSDLVALKNLLQERLEEKNDVKNPDNPEINPVMAKYSVSLGVLKDPSKVKNLQKLQPSQTLQLNLGEVVALKRLARLGLALCLILTIVAGFRFFGADLGSSQFALGKSSFMSQAGSKGISGLVASIFDSVLTTKKANPQTTIRLATDLPSVLGDETTGKSVSFNVNVPSIFTKPTEFKDSLTTNIATVGSLLGLGVIDTTSETTLERYLDISGDVSSPAIGGLSDVVVNKIKGISFGDIEPEDSYILMGDGDAWQSMSTEEITSLGTIGTGTWEADPIETAYGGTGLTDYAVGDLLYADSSSTLVQLNIGTANQILSTVGGIPKWVDVTAVSGVTGTGTAGFLSYWDTTTNITNTTGMYWDVTNSMLGIGTTAPAQALAVVGDGSFTTNLDVGGSLAVDGTIVSGGSITATGTLTGQTIDTGQGAYEIQDATTVVKGMASFSATNFAVSNGVVSVATGGIGPTELASTSVTAGSYGSGTAIPNFTVDADGRITDAGQTDISLKLLPTGTEGQTLYNNNGVWTALSSLFWDDANGRLGIGTTNPENRLEVVGNIRSSSKVIAGDLTLGYGNYSSYFTGTAKVENSDEYLYFTSSYNSNVSMDPENGNLSGYAWLEDLGWVDFGTQDNDAGPVNVNLTTGAVTGKAQVLSTLGYLDFNASPYASDVVYDTATHAFTGYVFSEDVGWIDFGDTGVSYGDPPKITTTATNQDLLIDPNGTGAIYFHGDTYKLTSAGDLTVNNMYALGYLGVGTTAPNDFAEIGGGVTIGNGYLGSNTAPANGLLVEGFVGIGTTNPLYALDVTGSASFTGNLHLTGALYDTSDSAGTDGQYLKSTATGTAWTSFSAGVDVLPTGTEGQMLYNNAGVWTAFSDMYWSDTSSWLGIGTTSPAYALDVTGTLGVGSTAYFASLVGVGTTAPGYSLEVSGGDIYTSGDLRVAGDDIFMATNTAGYLLLADGTNYSPTPVTGDIAIDANGQVTIAQNSVVLGSDTTGNYIATLADAGDGLITVNNSGTESAEVTLTITANSLDFSQFKDALSLDASTTITADNAETLSLVNTGTGASFIVYDEAGDASPFIIDASGNVGIGTTSPQAKLDVDGTIENGLMAWYPLDGNASDRSIGGHTASVSNSSCPTGYVLVPGNVTYGTSDFCVMQYEAKSVGGVATSQAAVTPWASITQTNAATACTNTGGHLITNNEWMTIARNVEQVGSNWSGTSVGSGCLFRGNVGSDDACGYNGSDPEYGTGRNAKASLTLSNGMVIWDFAGNVWEWISSASNFDCSGSYPCANMPSDSTPTSEWLAWNTITNYGAFGSNTYLGPSNTAWTSSYGTGSLYSYQALPFGGGTVHALLRGGSWAYTSNAGVFAGYLNNGPANSACNIGFRCVR